MTRHGSATTHRPVPSDDSGSAVVEFTMVSVLLVTLFLALLQLGLALHVRNTLVAAAADGARYAANADRTPGDGAERARVLIGDALSPRLARDVRAGRDDVGGIPTVYVEVRAPVPVIGFWGAGALFDVRGHALDEGTR